MSDVPTGAEEAPAVEPTTDQLTEPSTEKNPGEEPLAPNPSEPTVPTPDEPTVPAPDETPSPTPIEPDPVARSADEPSHEATGIGVLDVDDA